MKTTSTFHLKLPEGSDRVSPAAMNENMEIIGRELDYLAQGVQVRELPGGDPLYTQVSEVRLADLAEGDTMQLLEDGTPVNFVVAKINYEAVLNGPGRVLLVRAARTDDRDYGGKLGAAVQAALTGTVLPVCRNGAVTTGTEAIFSLSATELGLDESEVTGDRAVGALLPVADRLVGLLANEGDSFLLRSTGRGELVQYPSEVGGEIVTVEVPSIMVAQRLGDGVRSVEVLFNGNPLDELYIRDILPAFTLPEDFVYTLYQDGTGAYYDKQEYGRPRLAGFSRDGSINGLTVGNARIVAGSYTGTGTWGSSNPNSITFDFVPKLVVVGSATGNLSIFFPSLMGEEYGDAGWLSLRGSSALSLGTSSYEMARLVDTTMSWYHRDGSVDRSSEQFNSADVTYHWWAIG